MISKQFFVAITKHIKTLEDHASDVMQALTNTSYYETVFDIEATNLMDDLINELQADFNHTYPFSHIDIGEIFIAWWSHEEAWNVLVIDGVAYNPITAEEWYDMYLMLKEKFAETEDIDYASPKAKT